MLLFSSSFVAFVWVCVWKNKIYWRFFRICYTYMHMLSMRWWKKDSTVRTLPIMPVRINIKQIKIHIDCNFRECGFASAILVLFLSLFIRILYIDIFTDYITNSQSIWRVKKTTKKPKKNSTHKALIETTTMLKHTAYKPTKHWNNSIKSWHQILFIRAWLCDFLLPAIFFVIFRFFLSFFFISMCNALKLSFVK